VIGQKDRDSLLALIDIVALIGQFVPLRLEERKLVAECPFHPDHTGSLRVDPGTRRFRCLGCGVSGDAADFVARYDRVPVQHVLSTFRDDVEC
jgi:DNA primase